MWETPLISWLLMLLFRCKKVICFLSPDQETARCLCLLFTKVPILGSLIDRLINLATHSGSHFVHSTMHGFII